MDDKKLHNLAAQVAQLSDDELIAVHTEAMKALASGEKITTDKFNYYIMCIAEFSARIGGTAHGEA